MVEKNSGKFAEFSVIFCQTLCIRDLLRNQPPSPKIPGIFRIFFWQVVVVVVAVEKTTTATCYMGSHSVKCHVMM